MLVDLEWSATAGGHVKCWDSFAKAACALEGLDLTIHFAAKASGARTLATHVRYVFHKPVFSTRHLPFLGHVPDHTDLAPYHPALAAALQGADVIHTTDGFFAYAHTAEKIARHRKIPLVHSVHTDTVAYTEVFTRSFLETRFGVLSPLLIDRWKIPQKESAKMAVRLKTHQQQAAYVLVSRDEDKHFSAPHVHAERLKWLRLGVDRTMFSPSQANRVLLNQRYGIPEQSCVIAFVGRLDEGKNIYTLLDAMVQARADGASVFLIAAGIGPAADLIKEKLPHASATPGFLAPHDLAMLYASADWLALPSRVETWSLAAAEALSCGLPVLAAKASGVARFLDDAGFLVDDGECEWAAALKTAHDHGNREIWREKALCAAARHFPDWHEALEQDVIPVWQQAYREQRG